jgi:hypothetical protein
LINIAACSFDTVRVIVLALLQCPSDLASPALAGLYPVERIGTGQALTAGYGFCLRDYTGG